MLAVSVLQNGIFAAIFLSNVSMFLGLGSYIKRYAPLSYDSHAIHTLHSRAKRSFYSEPIIITIEAFDSVFNLSLHVADDSVFDTDAKLELDGHTTNFDRSHLFQGFIQGDPESFVSGSITKGVFQGIIRTGQGKTFYVDRKEYHGTGDLLDSPVHSVIYSKDDVDVQSFYNDQRIRRAASNGQCGLNIHSIDEEMKKVQLSALSMGERINKRATASNKKTCTLFLQSDPELWNYMKSVLSSAEDTMIVEEITSLFNGLVTEVNTIYSRTIFDGNNTGFNFRVDRIAINKTCAKDTEHPYCSKSIDVSNFLNLNTYKNHDAYCLAYVFTYREFADGTLGLAWVATPGSLNGGICSKYGAYSEGGYTRKKSLNTGIVTFQNYGARVPKLMSTLTLAHEIGHNFGSQHDETQKSPSCTPYKDSSAPGGNYIMYYAAIEGTRLNNFLFSPCSKKSIGAVLSSQTNTQCLIEKGGSWCGNRIKEPNEECDCGFTSDCADCCKCCVGQNDQNNQQGACTKKVSNGGQVQCDPSEGPCCASSCSFQTNSVVCRAATECAMEASCTGGTATCPVSSPKPDRVPCSNNTKICKAGLCDTSICDLIGWQKCDLTSNSTKNSSFLCYVSCQETSSSTCYSSLDVNNIPEKFKKLLTDIKSGDGIPLAAGTSCDQDQGFCDYFRKCRVINSLGPLARLKNLLLSFSSIENLNSWLKSNWWIPVLSLVGLIVVIALLVKFGTYVTPSSNPGKSEPKGVCLCCPTKGANDRYISTLEATGPHVGSRSTNIEMREGHI